MKFSLFLLKRAGGKLAGTETSIKGVLMND